MVLSLRRVVQILRAGGVDRRVFVGLAAMLCTVLAIAATGLGAFSTMRASARHAIVVGARLNSIGLEMQVHGLETERLVERSRGKISVNSTRAVALANLEEAAFELHEIESLAAEAVRLSKGSEAQGAFERLGESVRRYEVAAASLIEAADSNAGENRLSDATAAYETAEADLDVCAQDAETAGSRAGADFGAETERTGMLAAWVSGAISITALVVLAILFRSVTGMLRDHARMGAELDVARRLQRMVLPDDHDVRAVRGMDIAGYTESATEVGGDYYDVIPEREGASFLIGDVTGHGLESGVFSIMAQTSVRTLHAAGIRESRQMFDVLNKVLYENARRMKCDKNLTLALMRCREGEVTISGQHEEVLVVRTTGELERHDTLNLGFPLGIEENISQWVAEAKVPVGEGDVLVLYTDGITEATNRSGDLFGIERLCEAVKQNHRQSAEKIRDAVLAAVRGYMQGTPQGDDISLLVIKPA